MLAGRSNDRKWAAKRLLWDGQRTSSRSRDMRRGSPDRNVSPHTCVLACQGRSMGRDFFPRSTASTPSANVWPSNVNVGPTSPPWKSLPWASSKSWPCPWWHSAMLTNCVF